MRESKSTYRTMHLLLAGACEVLEPNHQFQYNLILFRLFGNTVFGIEILFVVQPEMNERVKEYLPDDAPVVGRCM